jgi:hypothetical protein
MAGSRHILILKLIKKTDEDNLWKTGVTAATDVIIFIVYVLRRVINLVFCLYIFAFVLLLPVCVY